MNEDPRLPAPAGPVQPVVARPREILPLPLAIALIAALGVALFLFLNARRTAADANLAATDQRARPAPPPLLVPAPAPSAPVTVITTPAPIPSAAPPPLPPRAPVYTPPRPAPVVPPQPAPPPPPGSSQPALVVDLTAGNGAAVNGPAGAGAAINAGEGDETVRATQIRNRATIVPQGALIAAVLETPLNSDRPGLARALVSQDVRGFDGTRVLIPRGSRLIGDFKGDPNPNLRRILVTWTRLIRPDGVAIRIGSPVSDPLGGAGVAGRANTHFFERFAGAVLQSALAVGVNLASQPSSGIYIGLPAQQVGQQIIPNIVRSPTVKVKEGAEITVFVARDLDFGGTPPVH